MVDVLTKIKLVTECNAIAFVEIQKEIYDIILYLSGITVSVNLKGLCHATLVYL